MARKKRAFNLFEGAKNTETEKRVSDVGYLEDLEKGGGSQDKPKANAAGPVKTPAKPQAKEKPASRPRTRTKAPAVRERPAKEYVRKTFVVHPDDLKVLQDIVHREKSSGNYMYTMKEALGHAIQLLKKKKG